MAKINKLSDNDLSECIECLNDVIYRIEHDYLHILEHLQTELNTLKNKYSRLCDEYERREEDED